MMSVLCTVLPPRLGMLLQERACVWYWGYQEQLFCQHTRECCFSVLKYNTAKEVGC